MPRTLSYLEAIGEALSQELDRDPSVFLLGEDNIGGTGCDGKLGNAWGPTKGLHERFPDRILDTPITEAAFVGAAVGAAATGMRPVVDLLFVDFMGVCFDQLLNQRPSCATWSAARPACRWWYERCGAPACAAAPSTPRRSTRCWPTCPASRWWCRRSPTTPRA